ncbi:hypothetical protein PtB15_4B7 [Puccinia triticina]|nr:hypothetical protein PtB15_4B7 [Puccinia triticina]
MVNQPNVTRAATAAAKKSKSSLSGRDATEVHRLLVPLPVVSEEGTAGEWSEVPSDLSSLTQDDWEPEPNNYKDTVLGDVPVEIREDPLVFDDEEDNTSGKDKQDAAEPDFIEFMKAVPDVGKTPIDPISVLLEQALAAQVSGNTVMANVFLKAIRELDPKKQQNTQQRLERTQPISYEKQGKQDDTGTGLLRVSASVVEIRDSTHHRLPLLPDLVKNPENSQGGKSKQLTSPSDPLDCPPEKLHPRLTTHSKPSSHTFDHSNQTHQTTTRTHEPNKQDRHTPAPSSLKPDHAARKTKSNKPLIDKSNQKRVAPISSDGSDSEHSETEPERSASRNRKKKARTQHDRPNPATASLHLNRELASIESSTATTTNDQSNGTNPNGFKDVQRKKRILSDCVSEVDADQAMRIKKGRSEKLSDLNRIRDPRRTPEVEDLMRVDKDEEEQVEEKEDEDEAEGGNAEKQSDQELYIIADDGRRKKLVKIRLGSPESADSQEENNVEQRWVTHKEFRRLKEDHQLLMDNDQWDSESTISSSDSFDSDSNRLSTPSKQTAERGPIWSIEGKPRPNPILPATELPLRVRPVSRPRNSLGRMRLSLPPDPASPSQLPRSRLISPLRPSVS